MQNWVNVSSTLWQHLYPQFLFSQEGTDVLFIFIYVNYVLQVPANHSNIINFTPNEMASSSDVSDSLVLCYSLADPVSVCVCRTETLISCTVINHMHWCSPHVFDRQGNKRKSKAECLWWSVAYTSGYTALWPAIHKKKSVVIDNPSAASSPSFSAHLCSPSVTLLFSLTQFPVMLLSSSVARSINTIK